MQNNLTPVLTMKILEFFWCHLQEIEGEQEGNPANTEFELDPVSKPAVVSDMADRSA
jgi:hypothetical protein